MRFIAFLVSISFWVFGALAQGLPDGVYYIKSVVNYNYVIGLPSGNNYNGNRIILWEYLGDASQQWRVTNMGDGSVRIQNVNNSAYSLDLDSNRAFNGNFLQVWQNYDNLAQKWYPVYSDGSWILHSCVDRRFVIDVESGKMFNDNKIQIWQNYGSNNQRWYFVAVNQQPQQSPLPSPSQQGLCTFCGGLTIVTCSRCGGNGRLFDLRLGTWKGCNLCQGAGHLPCPACGGSGRAH